MNKINVTVTLPNVMGGVASFNRNILKYFDRSLVKIRVILIKVKEINRVEIYEEFNCDEQLVFTFSNFDNQYKVIQRLSKLIGETTDVILTDNSITLNAISIIKEQPVVHYFNHDF